MPSFVDMGTSWGDTKEAQTAPAAAYDLRISDAEEYVGNSGNRSVRCRVEFVGNSDYASFFHYIPMPNPEKDAARDAERGVEPGSTSKSKILMTKRFLHLFGVKWDKSGYDPNKLVGKKARAEVELEMPDENSPPNARPQNRIRVPMLPDGVA